MFWQEETPADQFHISGDVVDLVFDINCRELPVDHAYALAAAIINVIPWVEQDSRIGIHAVHVAGSQNGWVRPEHNTQNRLILSHRTKLILRVPKKQQIPVQQGLTGVTLNVAACLMHIRQSKSRSLSKRTTLLARHIDATDREDETAFLNWAAQELRGINIEIRKALCGKTIAVATSDGSLMTRSLLLADLSLDESLRLQQQGLGGYRVFGCGLFLPHKGISAVKEMDGE